MHKFKSPFIESSHVAFDQDTYSIDVSEIPPTISELIKDVRKTGQSPISTQRPALPEDANVPFDVCRVGDKVEKAMMTDAVGDYMKKLEDKKKDFDDAAKADAAKADAAKADAAKADAAKADAAKADAAKADAPAPQQA